MYKRLVGLILVAVAVVGLGLFWWTLTNYTTLAREIPQEFMVTKSTPVFYSWQMPPPFAIAAAVGLAFGAAALFIGLEIRDINASRRSKNPTTKPLAPWVLMDETRGIFHGEITITVLIPAHNEELLIGHTIDSLFNQSRKPDRVIVVADNCTDRTVAIAKDLGVEVIESLENQHKKAGALNQVLAKVLPDCGPNDTVMIMDADTKLKQGFLASAVQHFSSDRGLSAIGGLFFGEEGLGLLGQLQRNEYIRYSREIKRRRGRVFVLTGTASIFRAEALKTVAKSRGDAIPGRNGDIYDVEALTEDNELTIALKSLGALMMSPNECQVETELMPSLTTLWRQRLRWQRGALENISAYGITSTTTKYWSQQLGLAYSVFALWAFFLLIFLQITATDVWIWYPYWLTLGAMFITERVTSAWKGGWRARLLAFVLVPELMYDSFLDLIFLKGVLDMAFRKQAVWGHEVIENKKTGGSNV